MKYKLNDKVIIKEDNPISEHINGWIVNIDRIDGDSLVVSHDTMRFILSDRFVEPLFHQSTNLNTIL